MISGTLGEVMTRHARTGQVEALIIRPSRRATANTVPTIDIRVDGLEGDHARPGKRAVTLLQYEHLGVIASLLGKEMIDHTLLRRNIVVSGLNLLGARKAEVNVGQARLHIHGPCPPCSRMEEVLGFGGYSAMRGHGGVYAEVVMPGRVDVGATVEIAREV